MQSLRSPGPTMSALQARRVLHLDQVTFGCKVRAARAILDLSQTEFAARVGLTQRSVHRIEQGSVEAKLRTMAVIEKFWLENGIAFEDLPNGGFCLVVERRSIGAQDEKTSAGKSPLV